MTISDCILILTTLLIAITALSIPFIKEFIIDRRILHPKLAVDFKTTPPYTEILFVIH